MGEPWCLRGAVHVVKEGQEEKPQPKGDLVEDLQMSFDDMQTVLGEKKRLPSRPPCGAHVASGSMIEQYLTSTGNVKHFVGNITQQLAYLFSSSHIYKDLKSLIVPAKRHEL